jgi:phenylacetate-coenzyme A ligase PaaK-like adenylate-forming protein
MIADYDIDKLEPYGLRREDKSNFLNSRLRDLSIFHYNNCDAYRKMMDSMSFNVNKNKYAYTEIPFLPVRLFKMHDLKSVPHEEIFKTMTSSGTSGQAVSKIYLDRDTAAKQTKVLTKIVASYLGSNRVPMIIIDSPSTVKNRATFSARGAGILGFSMFGSKRMYALNDNMELLLDEVLEFLEKHRNQKIFLFGFTFMIYQYFYLELISRGVKLDLLNATMIHGGGWKKLESQSISTEAFRKGLYHQCGIKHVHDYYGMVEQTGTIYLECKYGHLHTPIYSDIIVRRPYDFSVAKHGEMGLIQTVSILPRSYPGHSLLTEDEGTILGEDDCSCGRLGKYFKVVGRIRNAEIRGCSDTHSAPKE